MSTAIKTYELCSSCRAISLGPQTVTDLIESDGYTAHGPMNTALINNMLLSNLQSRGGCSKCIAVVNRYVNG